MVLQMSSRGNREFLSCPKPLFQIEVKCEAVNMEKIVSFHSNETRFPKKDFAFSLVLKVRVFGTRKWPGSSIFSRKKIVSDIGHKCRLFSLFNNFLRIAVSINSDVFRLLLLSRIHLLLCE